jgi:hypothetical protein
VHTGSLALPHVADPAVDVAAPCTQRPVVPAAVTTDDDRGRLTVRMFEYSTAKSGMHRIGPVCATVRRVRCRHLSDLWRDFGSVRDGRPPTRGAPCLLLTCKGTAS